MTVLDYFVLIVIVASTALGATRGIIKGLISILSAVAGIVLAAYLYRPAAFVFRGFVSNERSADLLGFVAVFLAVIVAGAFFSRWLRGKIRRARLDLLDRALGAGFGFARGWLVCSVLYLALTAFPVRLEAVERAAFAPLLLEGTRVVAYLTSSELRAKFSDGYAKVRELWDK
ncbi:MAG: CvpA family protein [Acidobacteriota bacterium]